VRQAGAEAHLVVVHGEVDQAAAELEELLPRVAVALVLLHRVGHGLLGQAVLQLEGGHRQAVDEKGQVEGQRRLVVAVAELPGDAEPVLPVQLHGLGIAGRGRAEEEVQVERPVLHAVAQHVDDAASGDLPLQPGQELPAGGAVVAEVQRRGRLRLGGMQEQRQLRQIHAIVPIVIRWLTLDPEGAPVRRLGLPDLPAAWPASAHLPGHGYDDQTL